MDYWKEGLLFGACAAACAAPVLFGSALVGLGAASIGGLGWGGVGMAAALVAVGAGFFLSQRFRPAPLVSAGAPCGCALIAGCSTGSTCDVPGSTTIETNTGNRLGRGIPIPRKADRIQGANSDAESI